jgi:cytochrome o ubiquinol oxidase subunit 2
MPPPSPRRGAEYRQYFCLQVVMVKRVAGAGAETPFRRVRPVAGMRTTLFLSAALLGGCSQGVLDPQGPIASAEKTILFNSLGIMLAIVIPTIVATLGVAYWYRASNTNAIYLPDWEYSGRLEMIVWSIPAMTVLLLGGIGWVGSHDLDPGKPIPATAKPVIVQVVSLDWKWLFIYPDQGIASVNRLTVPAGTPVSFQLTSSGVMNSFFVPQLGSQIYTMAGMVTRLHLQADKPGSFPGLSAQFSGNGFADMRFTVDAVPPDKFAAWVTATRGGGPTLDAKTYAELARPSQAVAPFTYSAVSPGLFRTIVYPDATATDAAGHAHGHMED